MVVPEARKIVVREAHRGPGGVPQASRVSAPGHGEAVAMGRSARRLRRAESV
jgi:hypothetical protein